MVQRLVAAAVAVAAAAPIGGDTKVPKSANGHKKGQEYLVDVRAEVRNRDGYSGEKERERERERTPEFNETHRMNVLWPTRVCELTRRKTRKRGRKVVTYRCFWRCSLGDVGQKFVEKGGVLLLLLLVLLDVLVPRLNELFQEGQTVFTLQTLKQGGLVLPPVLLQVRKKIRLLGRC